MKNVDDKVLLPIRGKKNMTAANFEYLKRPKEVWSERAEQYEKKKSFILQKHESTMPTVIVPLRAGKGHWQKLDGTLSENILTLLLMDTDAVPKIIRNVPVFLFGSEVQRTFAERGIAYYEKYGHAPGEGHLEDLVEDKLSPKAKTANLFGEMIGGIRALAKCIDRRYTLDNLDEFVRKQYLRQAITVGAENLQAGDLPGTVAQLTKGLERAGQPQGQGLLGLDAAVHTYGEFRKLEFPPVESALFPVLDHPGLLQINGFRGHFKTGLVHYMAVGLASGVDVFKWACDRAYKVLLVDAELPPATIQKRLKGVIADLGGVRPKKVRQNLHVVSKSENLLKAPINLADPSQADETVKFFSNYDVVVLDSIGMLVSGADLNDAQGWEVINTVCSRCIDNGTSIIRLQHLGKDKKKGGRGSIKQEDVLDFCLMVEQETPDTFHGNAAIKVTCTKHRHHAPSDFKPIVLEVSKGTDGQIKVTHELAYKNKTEAMLPEIMELMTKNKWKDTNKQNFAEKYDVVYTTVHRAETKATERMKQQEEENSLIN